MMDVLINMMKISKNSLSIFSILYVFQNISKPLLYKIFVKKKYVMLVGKNENAEIISKLLEEKQTYHIAEWTISEKYKEFERIISEKNISKFRISCMIASPFTSIIYFLS